jgi:hypothetical protein
MEKVIAVDAFNMLCGDKIGSGAFRDVFKCKLLPDMVVKVETNTGYRDFANAKEMKFWCDHQHHSAIADWLAPCTYLSPDGRVMLQKKVTPISDAEMPARLPAFLADIKAENFGRLEGRIVCVDYAIVFLRPSLALKVWDKR